MTDSQVSAGMVEITMTVNGEGRAFRAYPMERLLDVLRKQLALTGTKEGCGEGECGSCCVLMDGMLVNSCLVPALQAQGSTLLTIEGLGTPQKLHYLQEAFLEYGGAQCGICTPGMILAALHLLEGNSHPTMEELREGLAGNLCRCTGYSQILESIAQAAAGRPGA